MGLFGSKTTMEYGINLSGTQTWYDSESSRDRVFKRMYRAAKASNKPKKIQRSVKVKPKAAAKVEAKCQGGKCSRSNFCTKHGKAAGKEMSKAPNITLYDAQGRNKNGIRYDASGRRIWD